MAASASRDRAPTPSTPLLSTFQKHIEDMRNLVLCKICIKPLYEPYILGCGHTYCYTCLANWFGGAANRRKRKNCPDCRAHVSVQPSPNYLLRDLVHMFISRVELLPEDETTNEHDEAKREEAQRIETDKATGGQGLFKGAFTQSINASGARFMQVLGAPIRDVEDGVDRCPVCAWELEDGECNHCGYNDDDDEDFSDDDETRSLATPSIISINDSELDGEIDLEDHDLDVTDYDEDGFAVHDRFPRYPPNADISSVAADYPFSEDDDGESEMSEAPRRSIPRVPQAWTRPDRTIHDEDDESDGDDTEVPDEQNETETSEGDDDNDDSMSHGSVGTHETLSDSESDDGRYEGPFNHLGRDETPSAGEPHSPSSFYADAITAGDPGYGFSPPSAASPDSTVRDPTPQRDSSVEVVRRRNRNGIPRRPARVVISSDDGSDESTPTPPRPAGDRRAHLQGQRARRGGAGGTRTAQRHYRGR